MDVATNWEALTGQGKQQGRVTKDTRAEHIALGILPYEGIPLTISAIAAFQSRYPSCSDVQYICLFLLVKQNPIAQKHSTLLSTTSCVTAFFFFIGTLPGTLR